MYRSETAAAPAPPATLDETLARLAVLAGNGGPMPLPPGEGSERDRLFAALPGMREHLRPLLPALGGSLLARLLGDTPFDGAPSTRGLPREAKQALKAGEVIASAEATCWILVERPGGAAEISRAHPEGYVVLGESIGAWLAAEADAVVASRRPKRKAPGASGKEAIDAVLVRLAELSRGPDVREALANCPLKRSNTRWDYLVSAVAASGAAWSPAVLDALEGRLLGRLLSGKLHDTDDEACIVEADDNALEGVNPVILGRYPKPARALIEAGHIVGASGPEIWFILRDAKGAPMSWGISLHHAGYEGYERLADSVEGWLRGELARLEAILAP